MEFVKVGKNYLIKNGNGRIVSEKEKLELENKELVLEDIKSPGCAGTITKKISKNKKRIKEIEEQEKPLDKLTKEIYKKDIQEYTDDLLKLGTALEEKVQDEDNEETSKSI